MKMLNSLLLCGFLLACSSLALGQSATAAGHRTNTQIIDFILNLEEQQIIAVAEAMPAEKYSFAPTRGEFKGVRTFGEQLKHIAVDNYLLGAGILGERVPVAVEPGENGPRSLRGKAEIIAYVKESFAYMHRAAATIDDGNVPISTPEISPWPEGTATRLGVAIEDCVHTWDHYGQLVEYLRMNRIIPPASRKR